MIRTCIHSIITIMLLSSIGAHAEQRSSRAGTQRAQVQSSQSLQQQRQQYRPATRDSGTKWRNVSTVSELSGQQISPFECDYRLLQLRSAYPDMTLIDSYNLTNFTLSMDSRSFHSRMPIDYLESRNIFSSSVSSSTSLGELIELQRNDHFVTCDLILDPSSSEKLYLECSGTGPDYSFEGPDGEIITLPGGLFISSVLLEEDQFIFQEKC